RGALEERLLAVAALPAAGPAAVGVTAAVDHVAGAEGVGGEALRAHAHRPAGRGDEGVEGGGGLGDRGARGQAVPLALAVRGAAASTVPGLGRGALLGGGAATGGIAAEAGDAVGGGTGVVAAARAGEHLAEPEA